MNGKVVKNYQALDPNISTKIRKDDRVEIEDKEVLRSERFSVTFRFESVYDEANKNTIKGEKPMHLFSVHIVKKLQPSELLRQVVTSNVINDEAGRQFVKEVFKALCAEPNVGIPEMKVLNRCTITSMVIKFPGRVASCY